jgi:hypothetical protein
MSEQLSNVHILSTESGQAQYKTYYQGRIRRTVYKRSLPRLVGRTLYQEYMLQKLDGGYMTIPTYEVSVSSPAVSPWRTEYYEGDVRAVKTGVLEQENYAFSTLLEAVAQYHPIKTWLPSDRGLLEFASKVFTDPRIHSAWILMSPIDYAKRVFRNTEDGYEKQTSRSELLRGIIGSYGDMKVVQTHWVKQGTAYVIGARSAADVESAPLVQDVCITERVPLFVETMQVSGHGSPAITVKEEIGMTISQEFVRAIFL